MASNNNNNAALWSNIRKIKKKNTKLFNWIDLLACEIWKCDDKNKPILNKDGKLPLSRIDKLEENLVSSDWDTSSEDSLDEEIKKQLEDIQQIKDDIKRLDARAEHYATQQQLDVVAQLGRDNRQRVDIHGGDINDLEVRANALEADRDALQARIVAIEEQRSGTGGTGGGKRRRKRKTRKKRRKKKTKKRRKSRSRKKKKKTKRRR